MDLSKATAHFGLSAKATATRHGVTWSPRIGIPADKVAFPDADVVAVWTAEFDDASSFLSFDPGDNLAVTLLGAADEIAISGVTGTGSGSLNGTYTRDASVVNGLPAWTNGTATLRYLSGYYHLNLSGISQFVTKAPTVYPLVAMEISAGGSATGSVSITPSFTGAAPVLTGGFSERDFEGEVPPNSAIHGILVTCTAGPVAVVWGTGFVVLGPGQHQQLSLPGGEAVSFLATASTGAVTIGVFALADNSAATIAVLAEATA